MPDPRERDPRFPDRPTHRDFIRLSDIVQAHDDRAEIRGENPFAIAGVDEESIKYFMQNRMAIFQQRIGLLPIPLPSLMALYLDAFALGQRFTQARVDSAIEYFMEGSQSNNAEFLARRVRKAMMDGTYPPERSQKGDADE